MTQTQTPRPVYTLPKTLSVSPMGPNPLVADLAVANPSMSTIALKWGTAPTLFGSGNLPLITASGVAPSVLDYLPYHWRHRAAYESSPNLVLTMLERATVDPQAANLSPEGHSNFHDGLARYRERVSRWVNHGLEQQAIQDAAR